MGNNHYYALKAIQDYLQKIIYFCANRIIQLVKMAFNSFVKSNIDLPQRLKIDRHKNIVTGSLKIYRLKDGEYEIAYIPSLKMSGYGDTRKDAFEMLKEILADYFDGLLKLKKPQLSKELSKYGWEHTRYRKQYNNKVYIDKEGVLRNLDMPPDTKIEEETLEVA